MNVRYDPFATEFVRRRSMSKWATLRPEQVQQWAQQDCRYSITSSARASSIGGMVRPSALAVLRLMTRSNFVGC